MAPKKSWNAQVSWIREISTTNGSSSARHWAKQSRTTTARSRSRCGTILSVEPTITALLTSERVRLQTTNRSTCKNQEATWHWQPGTPLARLCRPNCRGKGQQICTVVATRASHSLGRHAAIIFLWRVKHRICILGRRYSQNITGKADRVGKRTFNWA